FADRIAEHAVRVVAQQVVRQLESVDLDRGRRRVAAVDQDRRAAVVIDRVVIDGDVPRSAADDREPRGRRTVRYRPRRRYVVEQVVADRDGAWLGAQP